MLYSGITLIPGAHDGGHGLARCRIPGGSGELLEVRAPSGNARRRERRPGAGRAGPNAQCFGDP